jgi:type VI secretion system secreted protein Hcp
MAVDAFIWFKNASGGGLTPEGETTDAFFSKEKAFGINDFTFGVENATTIGSATGGAGAGKVKFNEFTIRRTTDQSSPVLFKNCCVGAHYESVIIAMRKAGGDPTTAGREFLRFKFDTVFTTKIDWSGPGDEGPQESITFVYGKLGIMFTPPTAGLKPVLAGWDQVLNKDASDSIAR